MQTAINSGPSSNHKGEPTDRHFTTLAQLRTATQAFVAIADNLAANRRPLLAEYTSDAFRTVPMSMFHQARRDPSNWGSVDTGEWYEPALRLSVQMQAIIASADDVLCRLCEEDSYFASVVSRIYSLQLVWQSDMERAIALRLMHASNVVEELQRILREEEYWALPFPAAKWLRGARRVVFAGSGSLPLTALGLMHLGDFDIVCLDVDGHAVDMSRALMAKAGLLGRISIEAADFADWSGLVSCDAVLCGSLVGVLPQIGSPSDRNRVIQRTLDRLRPGVPLLIREPFGLEWVRYPSLDLHAVTTAEITRLPPVDASGAEVSGLGYLVLERR